MVLITEGRRRDVTAGRIHGQYSIPISESDYFFLISLSRSLQNPKPIPHSLSLSHAKTHFPTNPDPSPMKCPTTRPYAPGGREDCWSDDATSALITAWGDRYLLLNRGNLRQKDWKEVAAAVNNNSSQRPAASASVTFKTDGQCKNRIDTLKKKYKLEKSKPFRSPWIFYDTLDSLIGFSPKNAAVSSKPTPKTESEDEDDDDVDGGGGGVGVYGGEACREVARAISRFGKVYERMERWKQEQMVELEKQRMAFTKELEVSTLNMFMESQLELEKMNKRRKYSHNSSGNKL